MFETHASPFDRYREYVEIKEDLKKLRQKQSKLFTIVDKDTKAFYKLYKQRRNRLFRLMKADCNKCYGMGIPLKSDQYDVLYSERCKKCSTPNPAYENGKYIT